MLDARNAIECSNVLAKMRKYQFGLSRETDNNDTTIEHRTKKKHELKQ